MNELINNCDLSEVCIASLDGVQATNWIKEIFMTRSNETRLRIIWATELNENNHQNKRFFRDFEIEIQAALENKKYKLEFVFYAPKASFEKTWQEQLFARDAVAEIEAMASRIKDIESFLD